LGLREGVGSDALSPRVVLVDPGPEVGGPQLGESEEEVAEVALGIDHQAGDAVERRLLEEAQAEAGLSAARHAHAYRMGHEILGVVEEEPIAGLLGSEVVGASEIEDAELFEDLRAGGGRAGRGGRTRGSPLTSRGPRARGAAAGPGPLR